MKLTFGDESKGNRASFVMGRCFGECLLDGGLSRDETKELFKAFGDYLEVTAKQGQACNNTYKYYQTERNFALYQFCIELIYRLS